MIIFVQVVAIEQNYEMDSKRKNEAMEARKEWLEESENAVKVKNQTLQPEVLHIDKRG